MTNSLHQFRLGKTDNLQLKHLRGQVIYADLPHCTLLKQTMGSTLVLH